LTSYDEETIQLKPDMVLVPSPQSKEWGSSRVVKLDKETTAQAKADGEFNLLVYNKRGETFTKNKYGRKETAETVPAIADFVKVMQKQPINKAEFLVEMHVFDGKLLRVSDYIHYLKGKDERLKQHIRLGFFQMISVDGRKIREPASWQFEEMESMFKNQKRILVLPWTEARTRKTIEKTWKLFVDQMGYEGLVVRNGVGAIFKMKPEFELDAVIVALNKNDGYAKKRGTSLRLAIMIDSNTFLEIGDVASGITHDLRRQLWLMKDEFGMFETSKKHYVEPIAVVNVLCNGLFQKQMPCFKFDAEKGFMDLGTRLSITMRHPKLIQFRTDKTPCVKDVGLNQIPRGLFQSEEYGKS